MMRISHGGSVGRRGHKHIGLPSVDFLFGGSGGAKALGKVAPQPFPLTMANPDADNRSLLSSRTPS